MKPVLSCLQFLTIVAVFSFAASATNPFGLRAWHRVRWPDVDTNPINHHIEVEPGTGDAVINRTTNYPGFESFISPTEQEGKMHRVDDNHRAYLFPLKGVGTTPSTRHYQLRYSKKIPKDTGVLYQNFTTVGRDCGAMCGGFMLDYDIGGDRGFGEWYVIKEKGKGKRNVYKLRWIGLKYATDLTVYPEGGIPVYLWKDQL